MDHLLLICKFSYSYYNTQICLRIKGDEVVIYCIMYRGDTRAGEHGGPLCCHRFLVLCFIFATICGDRGCGFVRGDGRREGYPLRDDTLLWLGVSQSEG